MAPIKVPCPDTTCAYQTVEVEIEDAMKLLEMHERVAHQTQAPALATQTVKSEKVMRPQLVMKDSYVTEEAFSYFMHSWKEYKQLANVTTAVKQHLAKCLGEEVSTLIYGKYGSEGYDALTEDGLMEAAKGMVVKARNKLVMQLQLQKMMQGPDQPIQTYVASLKATARTCGYRIKCTDEVCTTMVDYTNAMVLQQMIRGLADEEIQRKLLAKSDLSMEDAEKFVMAEESGKWSQAESKSGQQVVAGMSRYKQEQQQQQRPCGRCGGAAHSSEGRVT